jgi:type IV pilus assembly protein PilQ
MGKFKKGIAVALWTALCGAAALAAQAPAKAAAAPQKHALNSMQALDYSFLPGGMIVIRVVFQHALGEPPAVLVHHHPSARVMFDFANMVNAVGRERVVVNQRGLRDLQVVQTGTRTRLVINLGRQFLQERAVEGNELLITLRRLEATGPRDRWFPDAASEVPRHALLDFGPPRAHENRTGGGG